MQNIMVETTGKLLCVAITVIHEKDQNFLLNSNSDFCIRKIFLFLRAGTRAPKWRLPECRNWGVLVWYAELLLMIVLQFLLEKIAERFIFKIMLTSMHIGPDPWSYIVLYVAVG